MKDKNKRLEEARAHIAGAKAILKSDDMYADIEHLSTLLDLAERDLRIVAFDLTRICEGMTDDDLHG